MFNLRNFNCIFCIAIICFTFTSCREIKVEKSKLLASDYRLFQDTPAWELAKAVEDNNVYKITRILNKDTSLVNYQEPIASVNVLMLAIYHRDYYSFLKLLEYNPNLNLHDKVTGASPIIYACRYNTNLISGYNKSNKKYVEKLLEIGANPNDIEVGERKEGNSTRYTPLRGAAEKGDLESVRLLIQYGATVNFYDEYGSCALGKSLLRAYYDVSLLLLEHGADYTKPLSKGIDGPLYIIDLLRGDLTELNTTKHFYKEKVIEFLKEHNIDYRKSPIPTYTLERIKKRYPDTWQEYIEKY